jgi:hypothetical protein
LNLIRCSVVATRESDFFVRSTSSCHIVWAPARNMTCSIAYHFRQQRAILYPKAVGVDPSESYPTVVKMGSGSRFPTNHDQYNMSWE